MTSKTIKNKKPRPKIVINNRMKALGRMDTETNLIEINHKAHKGDRAEEASSLAHELMHVRKPRATEKQVYKKTAKTKIPPQEQSKLLAKLKGATIEKTMNALKKKYKVEGSAPGAIYQKANELSEEKRVAIQGLI